MEPQVAAREPAEMELQAGKTYFWCQCGLSKKQPLCDGSHKGSGIEPLAYKAEKDQKVWLCQCKQTSRAPFCDGAHKRLP
ncbi:CDGSH iron-sulfur domain-containing protein [Tepidicaulis sp.]|uniref:CDGSH iron-sulfur domain-containing protein n=1 Tax=Tepidicaulis sp. TaxID=1920809 RepID=UPI003B5B2308